MTVKIQQQPIKNQNNNVAQWNSEVYKYYKGLNEKKKRERERKNIPTLICTPTDHLGSVFRRIYITWRMLIPYTTDALR